MIAEWPSGTLLGEQFPSICGHPTAAGYPVGFKDQRTDAQDGSPAKRNTVAAPRRLEETMSVLHGALCLLLLASTFPAGAAVERVPIKDGDFSEGADANGVPKGWQRYAGATEANRLELLDVDGRKALLIDDGDPTAEIGVVQTFDAMPHLTYQVSVQVRAVKGASTGGAYLQFRFAPSGKYEQVGLYTENTEEFEVITVRATAPADTKQAQIYLYSHAGPTPKVMVADVKVESGFAPPPPPPPPAPAPVPPQYTKLKGLHLAIPLVQSGRPAAAIVAPASGIYRQAAATLQQAILKRTGVKMPIVADQDPLAAVPFPPYPDPTKAPAEDARMAGLRTNLIVLGNRSTSRTMSALYDQYYSLADLKYPGTGGYAVRTVHNPYGDGNSVVVVGGSDTPGVEAGAAALAQKIAALPAPKGSLSLGWTMITRLGKGTSVPTDIRAFETWDASKGYGSVGYFGWCSISKRMAMYYMAGDEFSAREVVRLSFPDAQALKDIETIDQERIENKHDPLAGFYHYNAHMAILYWNLIEASPLFTDEERLKITNAFARQLNHRKGEGIYPLTAPARAVGSRHGQWAAMSLYCLGRYFNTYYPDPVWAQCVRGAQFSFGSVHEHAWVAGESDNLFWYSTGHAPVLAYMALTGDRKPLENGVLGTLLRGQELLLSGRVPDPNLNSAAISFLNQAAYLTGDGRWVTYRERTGVDTGIFRLGQSFWPDEQLRPQLPTDLAGKWSVHRLARGEWRGRGSGIPLNQSIYFASYRSAPDASGDYVLLDGYDGASRNPHHTFDILELRLNGRTVLNGYHNQVTVSADGMVEPLVPMDAALRYSDVLGPMAVAVGEVPRESFAGWRRTLAQRTGRYALVVDDLTFRAGSQNMKVTTTWQPVSGAWDAKEQSVRMQSVGSAVVLPGWVRFQAIGAACTSKPAGPDGLVALDGLNIMLLRATEIDSWLEMPFKLDRPVEGDLYAHFLNYADRGKVRASIDGKRVGEDYDNWADSVAEGRLALGTMSLPAGEHRLRLEVVDRHPGNERCNIGFSGLSIRQDGAAPVDTPATFDLRSCDAQEVTGGSVVTMHWNGAVKAGDHRVAFTVIGQGVGNGGAPAAGAPPAPSIACARVASNAAALGLPQPGLAVAGEYQGCQGELVVLAQDHLYGHALTRAGLNGALAQADAPVELDWDFASGAVQVATPRAATLALALAGAQGVTLDGRPAVLTPGAGGLFSLALAEGRHTLAGARPAGDAVRGLSGSLQALLDQGQKRRAEAIQVAGRPEQATAPAITATATARVDGKVVDLIVIPSAQGRLTCVAEEKSVHLLGPDGKEVRRLEADGKIRVLRWWDENRLLLVGCADEKVIAFDEAGQRKWVFTSVMDPAVYEAAKQYWFKSAPGHEGVHGLTTGVFYEGKSQCFVGSACTLEIIDGNGQLVKRMPIFWGPLWKFLLVDGPQNSINLLAAQWPNGSDNIQIVNNVKGHIGGGYYGVPAGHTFVGGWTAQNRTGLVCEDVNGDGKKEVVTAINGTWNRVTVYSATGEALANAQFGPGSNTPYANLRAMDLADLNGDGKKEILVGTSAGLVVALDSECRKVWSVRLPNPPVVLQAAGRPARLFVGCENRAVVGLDGQGAPAAMGQVNGLPTRILLDAGKVLIATAKGDVAVFPTQ